MLHRPLRYQGRNHGQETLIVVPGRPSGQQAYRSKVLLHTRPAGENSSVKSVLSFYRRPALLRFPGIVLYWHELILGIEGLTCGGGRGIEVVQALVFVVAPLLLHKLQGVSRGELQEEKNLLEASCHVSTTPSSSCFWSADSLNIVKM